MNKEALINQVAEESGLSKKDVTKALNTSLDVIIGAVAAGEKVELVGFGNFDSSERSARKGRNPQTGEEVDIPKSRIPKFKPGKKFKDAIPQPK